MKSKEILLTAVLLSLIMSTITAQAQNIQITSLPFNITAPGTYVLTGNLKPSVLGVPAAINISTAIAGPVVLDLKGFTIFSNFTGTMITIGSISPGVANTYPITIQNGTLFMSFVAESSFGLTTDETPLANNGGFYSDITINNIVFNGDFDAPGVIFNHVNSSTISNCVFGSSLGVGVWDKDSVGGNRYTNDTFTSRDGNSQTRAPLSVESQNPVVLDRCRFADPIVTQNAIAPTAALKAANIEISSLPFNITIPGNYVLTGNLTASAGGINISTALPGPVVLDLKGFTIAGPGDTNTTAVSIGFISPGIVNTYPIIIRNGTIQNFSYAVFASAGPFLSDITVHKIVFLDAFVNFAHVNSSTVSRCTFTNSGMTDDGSAGGNSYINDSFAPLDFFVFNQGKPCALDQCRFSAPPTEDESAAEIFGDR